MSGADLVTLAARAVTCTCLTVSLAIVAIWGSPTRPYDGTEILTVPTTKAMRIGADR